MKDMEYKMNRKLFNTILATRKETDKKQNPYTYAAKYINEQFDLKGTVTRVTVYDN